MLTDAALGRSHRAKDPKAKPAILRIGSALKEGNKVVGHFAVRSDRKVVFLLALPAVEAIQKVKF